MYFLSAALILGLAAPLTFVLVRKFYPEVVKKHAVKKLECLLFPKGHWQKMEVLKTFRGFTSERFSDEEILDYFFKIKGLQSVNIKTQTNFWVKRYLFSPTVIKLNYFEQVKFYETFLNFPEKPGNVKKSFFKPEKFARKHFKADHAPQVSRNIV
jgi:hypothetical protein